MTCTGCRKHWFCKSIFDDLVADLLIFIGDTVAFDGEQVPTTAETRGGPEGHRALVGDARQAAEQVIQFENMRIENVHLPGNIVERPEPNQPAENQPQRGLLARGLEMLQRGVGWRTETHPQLPVTETNLPNIATDPRRRHRQARAAADDEVTLVDHRVLLPDPPTSNIRSTQIAPRHRRRRPASHAIPRTRPSNRPEVITIAEDATNFTNGSHDGMTVVAQRHFQSRRERPEAGVEVIDLTQEAEVIDLTGED